MENKTPKVETVSTLSKFDQRNSTNKSNISVICGHFLHFAGDGATGSLLSQIANRLRFISTCVSV